MTRDHSLSMVKAMSSGIVILTLPPPPLWTLLAFAYIQFSDNCVSSTVQLKLRRTYYRYCNTELALGPSQDKTTTMGQQKQAS